MVCLCRVVTAPGGSEAAAHLHEMSLRLARLGHGIHRTVVGLHAGSGIIRLLCVCRFAEVTVEHTEGLRGSSLRLGSAIIAVSEGSRRRRIYQQVLRNAAGPEGIETVVVEQRTIVVAAVLVVALVTRCHARVACDIAFAGEVDGRQALMRLIGRAISPVDVIGSCEGCRGVERDALAEGAVAEVYRRTEHAVGGLRIERQKQVLAVVDIVARLRGVVFHDARRVGVVLSALTVGIEVVAQRLAEVDVVIREDGDKQFCARITDVGLSRYDAVGVAVVAIAHVLFHKAVATVPGPLGGICGVTQRVLLVLGYTLHGLLVDSAVGIAEEYGAFFLVTGAGSIALMTKQQIAGLQVVAVQQVGHLSVDKFLHGLLDDVEVGGGSMVCPVLLLRIVAVINIRITGSIANDRLASWRGCRRYPCVLDMSAAAVGNTATGERAHYTYIIYIATKLTKERLVESTDGVAVAVEPSGEAMLGGADGCPAGVLLRSHIAVEDKVEVLAVFDVLVEGSMPCERSACTEAEEVAEQVEFALLRVRDALTVVDVYLRVALHPRVVHIHVVLRVLHHLVHVVVVGHGDLYGIRVRLAEVGLGIVGHVVAVLIPVHRCLVGGIRRAVLMADGIGKAAVGLPSAAQDFVGALGHRRLVQSEHVARQNGAWRQQFADDGHAALEVDTDVHHMALSDGLVAVARLVALHILIPVFHGHDLVLREVVDVNLTAHVEGTRLRRNDAVDGEARLLVLQVNISLVSVRADDGSHRNGLADGVGRIVCYVLHLSLCLVGRRTEVIVLGVITRRRVWQTTAADQRDLGFLVLRQAVIYLSTHLIAHVVPVV